MTTWPTCASARSKRKPVVRRRLMANVRAERLLKIRAEPSPKLRIRGAPQSKMPNVFPRLTRCGKHQIRRQVGCAGPRGVLVNTYHPDRSQKSHPHGLAAWPHSARDALIRDNDGAYGQKFTSRLRTVGIWGSPDIPEVALAEFVCRASNRHVAARLPGSCPDLWRTAFAPSSEVIRALLQRSAHASGIEQGHAPTPDHPMFWNHLCHASSVRTTSSLRPDMIFGNDRRPKS